MSSSDEDGKDGPADGFEEAVLVAQLEDLDRLGRLATVYRDEARVAGDAGGAAGAVR
ncbi:hypothetical protein [Streptomyces sp. LaPpAH-108]|uniref:hypothetical protein n=1 Tax=Streptomyces sp. LaPpAH-108 TaxID=1155714 RepID=UPI000370AD2B|nr:hypothetical protein [Streptomyces sp. LaPpAH-108]